MSQQHAFWVWQKGSWYTCAAAMPQPCAHAKKVLPHFSCAHGNGQGCAGIYCTPINAQMRSLVSQPFPVRVFCTVTRLLIALVRTANPIPASIFKADSTSLKLKLALSPQIPLAEPHLLLVCTERCLSLMQCAQKASISFNA